jgi:hypothetical protein
VVNLVCQYAEHVGQSSAYERCFLRFVALSWALARHSWNACAAARPSLRASPLAKTARESPLTQGMFRLAIPVQESLCAEGSIFGCIRVALAIDQHGKHHRPADHEVDGGHHLQLDLGLRRLPAPPLRLPTASLRPCHLPPGWAGVVRSRSGRHHRRKTAPADRSSGALSSVAGGGRSRRGAQPPGVLDRRDL